VVLDFPAQFLNPGYVVLSGYDSPLYRKLYEGWRIDRRYAYASYAGKDNKRTEVLWMNFKEPSKLF